MAVVRTVLPRKGIIQPRHGDNYEADLDLNWLTIDNKIQDSADVQTAVAAAGSVQTLLQDLLVNGVVSGFTLSTSATLTPGLTTGVLYAQGKRFAPATPSLGAAPAPVSPATSLTSYLFYNSTTSFYYNTTGIAAATGDAFLGIVVASSTAVTAVTQATKLFGQVSLAPSAPGNFAVAHLLGRSPVGVSVFMTSGGAIWFQSALNFDAFNLFLVASDAGVTAKVQIK